LHSIVGKKTVTARPGSPVKVSCAVAGPFAAVVVLPDAVAGDDVVEG
jgi:hypothetical protein